MILIISVLIALTFLGCDDPMVLDVEGKVRESGFFVEQELQRYRNASPIPSRPVSLPPAQPVDMEAERRELDRMIARGDWQTLF